MQSIYFITTLLDHKESRKLARDSEELSRMRLKRSAVPHVFSSLPKYLSIQSAKPRSTAGVGNYFTRRAKFGKTVEAAGRMLIEKQGEDLFF